MSAKQFYIQKATIGYRVFVHNDASAEVHEFFRGQSVWGGADKSGDNYLSYEMENEWSWMVD